MIVLGLETSCDDTSAAVVSGGTRVLASVVSSQTDAHRPHGGVVPEIASRSHVEALPGIIDQTLRAAGVDWGEIAALAVTRGPGLASSLMAGLVAARGISCRLDCPLWTLNHLEAHIYSVFLDRAEADLEDSCPALFLTVSGGHSNLILMKGLQRYRLLGATIDDAAGEALDKAAKLMGLGYPGGPAIELAASGGDPGHVDFPRAGGSIKSSSFSGALDPEYCFSFSGVKTSLLYYLRKHPDVLRDPARRADVAASYQMAVVDALARRVKRALQAFEVRSLACGGGVMRNKLLRARMEELADRAGLPLLLSRPEYCTDNAAMVAGLGAALAERGLPIPSDWSVEPRLALCG